MHFHFSPGAETTQDGLALLGGHPQLHYLGIMECVRLPDELTLNPDWLPELINLHLDLRHLTPDLVAQLTQLPNLVGLSVDGSSQDKLAFDAGVLTPLTRLTWLSMANMGEGVTDKDLSHVASLVNLKELDLSNTAVTEVGMQTLRTTLPNCRIETDFGTFGPPEGVDRRAAEWVLSIGGTVQTDQSDQSVSEAADLPQQPFRLTHVGLYENRDVTDDGLVSLRGCTELSSLVLADSSVTEKGLLALGSFQNLKELNLFRDEYQRRGPGALSGM